MSEIEQIEQQDTEAAERPFLVRTFDATYTPGDGRTVDVRVVPYDTPAEVSDGGPVYREEWAPGVFDEQLRAANRVDVLLNFEHEQGIGGLVGRGLALRSQPDGFHATFRVFETQDGDKALELIREQVLGGVSLEAYAKRSIRTAEGVVRRVRAHLDKVALCRRPAFKDALVLAVRNQPGIILDAEFLPVDMDPELVERCRQFGIPLPQRYQAQPAEDGHPGETGTPEDGTRQIEHTPTSEGRKS